MELSKEKVNIEVFHISFENDYDTGLNELEVFGGIVKKWYKESNKAGFKKMFNTGEKELINGLYNTLFKEETPNGYQNMGNGLTYVDGE